MYIVVCRPIQYGKALVHQTSSLYSPPPNWIDLSIVCPAAVIMVNPRSGDPLVNTILSGVCNSVYPQVSRPMSDALLVLLVTICEVLCSPKIWIQVKRHRWTTRSEDILASIIWSENITLFLILWKLQWSSGLSKFYYGEIFQSTAVNVNSVISSTSLTCFEQWSTRNKYQLLHSIV